jgi:hypothetical protein
MKNEQSANTRLYSPRATLCAIGIKLRSLKFFDTIAAHMRIRQKTIHHTPIEKLTDAFIALFSQALTAWLRLTPESELTPPSSGPSVAVRVPSNQLSKRLSMPAPHKMSLR